MVLMPTSFPSARKMDWTAGVGNLEVPHAMTSRNHLKFLRVVAITTIALMRMINPSLKLIKLWGQLVIKVWLLLSRGLPGNRAVILGFQTGGWIGACRRLLMKMLTNSATRPQTGPGAVRDLLLVARCRASQIVREYRFLVHGWNTVSTRMA